ncbi:TVP38/TMEM64 family protein [Aidingimonas lacisalsi]|uniref:TVP38/TMEM64 family protein n=1 Tax=Aidingimonas lacisalsi TaxID=2604086 RepID=UPI001F3B6ABE|nr:TVP38/TMEM64 family protein [Aidingimonas lacisalsi]
MMRLSVFKLVTLLIALAAIGALWQWLALQQQLSPQTLLALAQGSLAWRDASWAVLVIIAIYASASLMMFPLSILVAATGLLYGPWWGFLYALGGTMTASILTYWVGRRLGRDALLRHGGQHLRGASRYLAGRGIRTMTIVNLLPLAPFTLTNMLAGAFHLRFFDYVIGSVVGIVPGLLGITLLGSQAGELVQAENRWEFVWAMAGLAAGVALLYAMKRYAAYKQRHRKPPPR